MCCLRFLQERQLLVLLLMRATLFGATSCATGVVLTLTLRPRAAADRAAPTEWRCAETQLRGDAGAVAGVCSHVLFLLGVSAMPANAQLQ